MRKKKKILLTGANGYIGRRLLPELIDQGYHVVCMVRSLTRFAVEASLKKNITIIEADLLRPDSLSKIPPDIVAAYYLVHSMSQSADDFENLEQQSAKNFKEALAGTSVKQVIYLGGISNDENLSEHLSSRRKVEDTLGSLKASLTVLRSAIIVGSGSASFEIIRDLVEKLPVMITPRWLKTRCQPIAVRNVIEYLTGVLLKPKAYNRSFDIGGPDILSYKEMLLRFARIRGYRRYILTVPVLTPRLSSYWLYFVTATSFQLARHLVDSMRNEVICSPSEIDSIVPIEKIGYDEAVEAAFHRVGQNLVISSWKDALNVKLQKKFSEFIRVPTYGCYVDEQVVQFSLTPAGVVENFFSIGGDRGWYYADNLWRTRGFIDQLLGGVGLRRGRRLPHDLRAGDALDFWRVLFANKKEGRLMLYAEMILPGEAWLEFKVDGKYLVQTATFRPRGLMGRLYWWSLVPFHVFIFKNMARNIARFQLQRQPGLLRL